VASDDLLMREEKMEKPFLQKKTESSRTSMHEETIKAALGGGCLFLSSQSRSATQMLPRARDPCAAAPIP